MPQNRTSVKRQRTEPALISDKLCTLWWVLGQTNLSSFQSNKCLSALNKCWHRRIHPFILLNCISLFVYFCCGGGGGWWWCLLLLFFWSGSGYMSHIIHKLRILRSYPLTRRCWDYWQASPFLASSSWPWQDLSDIGVTSGLLSSLCLLLDYCLLILPS